MTPMPSRLAPARLDLRGVKALFGARKLIAGRQAALVAFRAGSDAAGKGAFLIVTLVAARRLPPQAFGVFAIGSTLGWLAAVATDAGMQLHLARTVAREPWAAARLLRRWLPVRLGTAGAALCLVAAGVAAGGVTDASALLLFAFAYLTSGLVEFLHHFYRGLSRSDIESTLTLLQRGATLVCAVAALVWRPDVTLLAIAMALPAVAAFAASLWIAARLGSDAERAGADDRPRHGVDAPAWTPVGSELRRDVLPIGLGIVLSALYFRIDVFLIDRWSGTGAVGLYSAVFRLVEALRLFPAAVLAVALPALCRAASVRPLGRVAVLVTAFACVVAGGLWVSAEGVVAILYGSPYAGAVPAFKVLLLSFPLMSLNYALTHQLIGWNGHRAYAMVAAAALGLNLALNARLIPAASIVGAAWATVWTEALVALGCAAALWRGLTRPGLNAAPEAVSS
jgi:O-antigen/teichoic acid export membrane protein